MKSDTEIEAAIASIFTDFRESFNHDGEIKIERSNGSVFVSVTQMYDAPEHGLSMVEFVAAMTSAVGLPEMEEYSEENKAGCETCDYGSCYGTTFRFWDPKAPEASK